MASNQRKHNRSQDLTRAYHDGRYDEDDDRDEAERTDEKFGERSKDYQKGKTARTQEARSDDAAAHAATLPLGQVVQMFSLFTEVLSEGVAYRCVQRKTLAAVSATQIVVGDRVRFTPSPNLNDIATPEGVIERIEPRDTVLTRSDSFNAVEQHPIVANADQMLIVASLHRPEVRWGLVDRMVIAASSGKLRPVICLNKIDTAVSADDLTAARAVLDHYRSVGVTSIETSVTQMTGIDEARQCLKDQVTVLAGHSGVGKSSLICAIEPTLDIRVGDISAVHGKGMHTTTSARRYKLVGGGEVIDTPGVKMFGLWKISRSTLVEHFPDVAADSAPLWRRESYERILESLPEEFGDRRDL